MDRVPDQEIFSRTLNKMRAQGVRCVRPFAENGHAACAYVAPDPDDAEKVIHCAVGCHLLPADIVQLEQDDALGYGVCSSSLAEPLAKALGITFDMGSEALLSVADQQTHNLLVDLQSAHDKFMPTQRSEGLQKWERQMARLADKYHFEYTAP